MDKQKQEDFINRIKKYTELDAVNLKKFKIERTLIINHPKKQGTGFIARIVLTLLGRMGYVIDTQYRNLKK